MAFAVDEAKVYAGTLNGENGRSGRVRNNQGNIGSFAIALTTRRSVFRRRRPGRRTGGAFRAPRNRFDRVEKFLGEKSIAAIENGCAR